MGVAVSCTLAQSFAMKWVVSWSTTYSQDQREGQRGKSLVYPETEKEVGEVFIKQMVTSGVPQGLVMEFIQYNMFINDFDCGTKYILKKLVGDNKLGRVLMCIRVGLLFR